MTELRASVRQVVEFSLHERDLFPAAFAAKRMREGAAAHKARQSAGAREETAYQAEKSLSADYAAREITLRVTGRADGLLLAADGARIVEEIKLGTVENPLVPAHRAQAAMYGHMLCQKEGLTGVRLRILYVDENGAPVRLYEEEADVVVCDYNYVFDPFVAIDALMQGGAALLIDEAHQLAPRVQDNASAAVSVPQLRALRRGAGQALGRKHPLYGALTAAMRALEEAAGTEEFASGRLERPPEALDTAMARLLEAADGALLSGAGTEAAEAFTLAACWRYAAGRLDARYAVLTEGTEKTAKIELFLLCAAQDILEKTKRARGAVFFSATLAPFEAAKRMLGSLEGDACLALPSPFDKRQLDARILPIDLRYAAREANAPRVAEAIRAQLAAHPGNAMVFFPSYAYLSRVDALLAAEGVPGAAILREARGLTEEEKNALLGAFDKRDGRTVLLAVLGGAFAEGVDLAGERLQNVIVVSTGLPQMDARVRAMRRYHDENGADGAFLCMTLPGMVRVIQSAGRLIRTQSDHGALLLIDSRYQRGAERALLSGTLIGDALSG